MPEFGIDDLTVTPLMFFHNCSESERDELHCLITGENEEDMFPRSYGQQQFNNNLMTLKKLWYSLTPDDVKMIEEIVNKY